MCGSAVRCGDFIFRLVLTANCAKAATFVNGTRLAGDGVHPVPIASGRRTSYDALELMMRIRVKLFAALGRYVADATAGVPFVKDVPEGFTLGDLVSNLKLPPEEVKVFFVNGRARPIDWSLEPDDEVGIFPLVAGG